MPAAAHVQAHGDPIQSHAVLGRNSLANRISQLALSPRVQVGLGAALTEVGLLGLVALR